MPNVRLLGERAAAIEEEATDAQEMPAEATVANQGVVLKRVPPNHSRSALYPFNLKCPPNVPRVPSPMLFPWEMQRSFFPPCLLATTMWETPGIFISERKKGSGKGQPRLVMFVCSRSVLLKRPSVTLSVTSLAKVAPKWLPTSESSTWELH